VRNKAGASKAAAIGAVVALSVLLAGCVQTTEGRAIKAHGSSGPASANVPPLKESQLSQILLSAREINKITGAKDMAVTTSAEDMSDHSDVVSDLNCLGAVYGAETPVYAGSGWTAVRDQVVREPTGSNDHWVEQTAVLYPPGDKAKDFFKASHDAWQNCAKSSVTVDDTNHTTSYIWNFENVKKPGDSIITQDSSQEEANGWACQHAMGVVSNLIAESFACGYRVSDEAEQIVKQIMDNAGKK
jgi:predicted small secreted protein